MADQYLVFLVERPACRIVVNHRVLHILYYLQVYVFDLPLPWHALVDSGSGEGVRKPVEPIVQHIVVIDQLN